MADILTGEELEKLYYNEEIELNSLSVEDLIVLSDYLSETELNEHQTNLLEKCLKQLSNYDDFKLISDPKTNEKTWNDIIEKYDQKHISHSRKNFKLKRGLISILAASVTIFGISAIVCYANGTSILGLFYGNQKYIVSNNPEAEISTISIKYTDYDKFITDNTNVIIPSYIPEGYYFIGANAYIDNEQKNYTIIYKNGNYSLKLKQIEYLSDNHSVSLQSETNGECIMQYSINDIYWNIYSNNNKNSALSYNNNIQYSINTYENIDEIKKITDFIY